MDLKTEEWRDIPGFEGYYQASNCGKIRSIDRYVPHNCGVGFRLIRGRILKQQVMTQTQYYSVMLSKDGKAKSHTVHSLIALTFLQKRNETDIIDHIDGNRQNNILTNLRYVSHKENANNPATKQNMHMWEKGHMPWNKGLKYKRKRQTHL